MFGILKGCLKDTEWSIRGLLGHHYRQSEPFRKREIGEKIRLKASTRQIKEKGFLPLSTIVIPGATAQAATIAEKTSIPKASLRLFGFSFWFDTLIANVESVDMYTDNKKVDERTIAAKHRKDVQRTRYRRNEGECDATEALVVWCKWEGSSEQWLTEVGELDGGWSKSKCSIFVLLL